MPNSKSAWMHNNGSPTDPNAHIQSQIPNICINKNETSYEGNNYKIFQLGKIQFKNHLNTKYA